MYMWTMHIWLKHHKNGKINILSFGEPIKGLLCLSLFLFIKWTIYDVTLNLHNISVFRSLQSINSPGSHKPIKWPDWKITPTEGESSSQRDWVTSGQMLYTLFWSRRIIISTISNGSNISVILLLWLRLSELTCANTYYYYGRMGLVLYSHRFH